VGTKMTVTMIMKAVMEEVTTIMMEVMAIREEEVEVTAVVE